MQAMGLLKSSPRQDRILASPIGRSDHGLVQKFSPQGDMQRVKLCSLMHDESWLKM